MVLLVALAFTAAWGRSFLAITRVTIPLNEWSFNRIVSFQGSVAWERVMPLDESRWKGDSKETRTALFRERAEAVAEFLLGGLLNNEDKYDWKFRSFGIEFGQYYEGTMGEIDVTIWKISYWLFITPLTLLSSYLLVVRPRSVSTTRTEHANPL